MIVATAGHIDHGKTALIRALTGVETDRLPEERSRGISIDLGFAYWRPDDGETIGFVDVPGHERFVRNMLAGLPGVDFALLIVAADDGVMPQTVEHVQILDLLGVTHGLVAITKCDRATPERVAEVRAQIGALLAGTGLADIPMFDVSSVTGAGIDALSRALRAARNDIPQHAVKRHNFRMAVDRAFSVTGAGTVAAGTIVAGTARVGDRLMLSPRGLGVRVRGLQSGGKDIESAEAGQRCAINLAGVELTQVKRGALLVTPAMHVPTTRIEARIKAIAGLGAPLKHDTPVHLHLGTADLPARILIAKQRSIAPGADAVSQLVLEKPASAINGERFVLRDQSGRQLLGGGTVIDPLAPHDRRLAADRVAVSSALELFDPEASLNALLAIPGQEIDAPGFERRFNLDGETAREIYRKLGIALVVRNRTLILHPKRVERIVRQVREVLAGFHTRQPDLAGMRPAQLREAIAEPISAEAFAAVLKDMSEKRLVDLGGSLVKLPGHNASFSDVETELWRKLMHWIDERDPRPFTIEEAVGDLRIREGALKSVLYKRCGNGDLVRIDERRYVLTAHIAELRRIAASLGDGFTAAQFRDASGIGRNLVIQILEYFDRAGITIRTGDYRRVRSDAYPPEKGTSMQG